MPYAFVSWRLRKILPVEIVVISPSQAVTDDVLPEITDMEEAIAEALDEHAGIYIFQFELILKKFSSVKKKKIVNIWSYSFVRGHVMRTKC